MSEWILCKDKLPAMIDKLQVSPWVLLCIQSNYVRYGLHSYQVGRLARYYDGIWWETTEDRRYYLEEVIAWLPFPKCEYNDQMPNYSNVVWSEGDEK